MCSTARFAHEGWAFRGHGIADWRLETALERACLGNVGLGNVDVGLGSVDLPDSPAVVPMSILPQAFEREVLLRFQRRAHHYIPNPPTTRTSSIGWLSCNTTAYPHGYWIGRYRPMSLCTLHLRPVFPILTVPCGLLTRAGFPRGRDRNPSVTQSSRRARTRKH